MDSKVGSLNPPVIYPMGEGNIQQVGLSNNMYITPHPQIKYQEMQPYGGTMNLNYGVNMQPNQVPYPSVPVSQEENDIQKEITALFAKREKTQKRLDVLYVVEEKERKALQKKQGDRRSKITNNKEYIKVSKEVQRLQTKKSAVHKVLQDAANRKVDKKKFMEDFLKDTKARDVNKNASDVLKEADAAFEILNPLT